MGEEQWLCGFTHDLDFGVILAVTNAMAPSVIKIRTQDAMPAAIESLLNTYTSELEAGALVVVEEARARVRILPMQ